MSQVPYRLKGKHLLFLYICIFVDFSLVGVCCPSKQTGSHKSCFSLKKWQQNVVLYCTVKGIFGAFNP